MPTEKRRFEPAVIERLFAQPHRFEYFQVVRMLELWLKKNGVPHDGAVANFLRFQNSTSLSFPASRSTKRPRSNISRYRSPRVAMASRGTRRRSPA